MEKSEARWLEVSLVVDGEMAEAVSEVLSRFAPEGVVIESTAVTAEEDDSEGRPIGPLRVCAYLAVDEGLGERRQRLEEALWYLGRIRPLPEVQYRLIGETDWSESWKEHYQPMAIGKRLMVIPAWLESPDPSRVSVRIDPGMAFGTGTHPSTQLCLELLEAHFEQAGMPLGEVIDVGCGSGILAVAALALGATRALAVDIDPEAIRATSENAILNGVSDSLEVGTGSVGEIRRGQFSIQRGWLVLTNILAPVIIKLLDEGLGELLTPEGSLIVSGILEEQSGEVEAALLRHRLRVVVRRQMGDWVALEARRG